MSKRIEYDYESKKAIIRCDKEDRCGYEYNGICTNANSKDIANRCTWCKGYRKEGMKEGESRISTIYTSLFWA